MSRMLEKEQQQEGTCAADGDAGMAAATPTANLGGEGEEKVAADGENAPMGGQEEMGADGEPKDSLRADMEEVAKEKYATYKERYMESLEEELLRAHGGDDWFMSRYHPRRISERLAAKRIWAAEEAGRFLDGFRAAPNDFVASASLWDDASHSKWTVDRQGERDEDDEGKLDAKSITGHSHCTVFIRSIPFWCSVELLESSIKAEVGGLERIAVGDATKHADSSYVRPAWAIFSTVDDALSASRRLSNLRITGPDIGQNFKLQCFRFRNGRSKVLPGALSTPESIEKDASAALDLAAILDEEAGVSKDVCLASALEDERVKGLLQEMTRADVLDVAVAYLRRVHFYQYYSGQQSGNEGELLQDLSNHVRSPPPQGGGEDAEVVEQVQMAEGGDCDGDAAMGQQRDEEKGAEGNGDAAMITTTSAATDEVCIERKLIDEGCKARMEQAKRREAAELEEKALKDLEEAARIEDDALARWLDEKTKPEEATGHARCGIEGCGKLFQDATFVHKHLKNKHPSELGHVMKEAALTMVQAAYREDPRKPVPTPPMENPPQPRQGKGAAGGRRGSEYNDGGRGGRYADMAVEDGFRGGDDDRMPDIRPEEVARHGDVAPVDPRQIRGYVDVDAPEVNAPTLDYGNAALPPPPKKKRKKSASA